MNGQEIKQALHAKGFSLAMIAEAIECHPNVLSNVIYRRGISKPAADAIAKVLGTPVTDLFPDVPSYARTRLPSGKAKAEKQATLQQLLAS
jgi:lambda repressor-like predicted transcriptional regulator